MKFVKFVNMKKFIVPAVLLLAVLALVGYLRFEDFNPSNIDGSAYLAARSKIDALEQDLWAAKNNPERAAEIRAELAKAWEVVDNIREPAEKEPVPEAPKATPAKVSDVKAPQAAPTAEGSDNSLKTVFIIAGTAVCIVLVVLIIILLKKVSKKNAVDDLEAQKAALSSADKDDEPLVIEERFRNPKGGFSDDDLTFTRVRGSKRPSIIDEADAFAEAEREKEKAKEEELAAEAGSTVAPQQTAASFAFEDSDGIPENRIMSTVAGASKPSLRPTAKERITSALQNLSSALTRPRGISRDQTMHLRTQSHNTMVGMRALNKSALDVTRFDKEQADLTTVKKLKSQGCTPGMIAQKMNITEKDAETLITKVREKEN